MARGDKYTNFGGEKLILPYEEAILYLNRDVKLIVRGVNKEDIGRYLSKNVEKFKEKFHGSTSPSEIIAFTPELSDLV